METDQVHLNIIFKSKTLLCRLINQINIRVIIMQQVYQYSRSLQGKYVGYLSIYKVRSHIQLLSRASLIRISGYSVFAVIRKKICYRGICSFVFNLVLV